MRVLTNEQSKPKNSISRGTISKKIFIGVVELIPLGLFLVACGDANKSPLPKLDPSNPIPTPPFTTTVPGLPSHEQGEVWVSPTPTNIELILPTPTVPPTFTPFPNASTAAVTEGKKTEDVITQAPVETPIPPTPTLKPTPQSPDTATPTEKPANKIKNEKAAKLLAELKSGNSLTQATYDYLMKDLAFATDEQLVPIIRAMEILNSNRTFGNVSITTEYLTWDMAKNLNPKRFEEYPGVYVSPLATDPWEGEGNQIISLIIPVGSTNEFAKYAKDHAMELYNGQVSVGYVEAFLYVSYILDRNFPDGKINLTNDGLIKLIENTASPNGKTLPLTEMIPETKDQNFQIELRNYLVQRLVAIQKKYVDTKIGNPSTDFNYSKRKTERFTKAEAQRRKDIAELGKTYAFLALLNYQMPQLVEQNQVELHAFVKNEGLLKYVPGGIGEKIVEKLSDPEKRNTWKKILEYLKNIF